MIIPLNKHIEIELIPQDTLIQSQNTTYEEKGKVLSVAEGVNLVSKGDIVYFDSWMQAQYEDSEKKIIHLIPEEAIRAKDVSPLSKLNL